MAQDTVFNADGVKAQIGVFQGSYQAFCSTTTHINNLVSAGLNSGLGSAIHGIVGGALKGVYENNIGQTAEEYKNNFDEWEKAVAVISSMNKEFTVAADAEYRSNSGNVSTTAKFEKADSQAVMNALAQNSKPETEFKLNLGDTKNEFGGDTIGRIGTEKVDGKDQQIVIVDVKDEAGNVVYSYKNVTGDIEYFKPNSDGTLTEQNSLGNERPVVGKQTTASGNSYVYNDDVKGDVKPINSYSNISVGTEVRIEGISGTYTYQGTILKPKSNVPVNIYSDGDGNLFFQKGKEMEQVTLSSISSSETSQANIKDLSFNNEKSGFKLSDGTTMKFGYDFSLGNDEIVFKNSANFTDDLEVVK